MILLVAQGFLVGSTLKIDLTNGLSLQSLQLHDLGFRGARWEVLLKVQDFVLLN